MTLKNSSREHLYYCYKSSYRIYPTPIAPSCKGSGIIYRYFPKDIPTKFDCGKQKNGRFTCQEQIRTPHWGSRL